LAINSALGAGADNTILDKKIKKLEKDMIVVGTSAPESTEGLWVDTGNGGVMKYYNGTSWVTAKSVWG